MFRSSTRRSVAALALVATTALVAGCGGDDDPAAIPEAKPTGVTTAPGDVATSTQPKATEQAVPSGGPTGIKSFPIPPGVDVKGPGATDESWQFDIFTKDTDGVVDFYRDALPKAGYDIKENVEKQLGAETVKYDIEFTGPAHGFIVALPDEDDVFVVVQSPPKDPGGS